MPDLSPNTPTEGGSGSKRNSREEKNFRSNYYEKVGFNRGVDEGRKLDILLQEDPINVTRCAAFAVR